MSKEKAKELERIARNTGIKDEIRLEAVKALGNLGSDGAESLRRIAEDTGIKDKIRIAAVKQLGRKD